MDIKNDLNEQQYKAASSDSKYLRIIAGAGTGKTRTLTYRLANLIQNGESPSRIVAITFTNKATKEMSERVSRILAQSDVRGKPLICTFHSFCCRFLRNEISALDGYSLGFNIMDEADANAMYKPIFEKMTKGSSKDFAKAIIAKISELKTDAVFPEDVTESDIPTGALYNYDELMYVYTSYQAACKRQNLLDFDDLMMLTLKIMQDYPDIRRVWQSKYDHFLVDEFQDTNWVQYDLIKYFLGPNGSLTVVGDPDQTIYTWRGAENVIITKQLQEDFPELETVVLDENYRSTQSILDKANQLIDNNKDRTKKELHAASRKTGEEVHYNRYDNSSAEARNIAQQIKTLKYADPSCHYSDIAVIYRSNYLSRSIESEFNSRKIPYAVYGGLKFYERAEIKDALAYLRLALLPDIFSFKRVADATIKGIGDKTMESADALSQELECDILETFRYHQDRLSLKRPVRESLDYFLKAYDAFRQKLSSYKDTSELVSAIRDYYIDSGFLQYVKNEDKKNDDKYSYTASTSSSKVDNVNEFLQLIQNFFDEDYVDADGIVRPATLEDFLFDAALQSAADEMKDSDKVLLMTGHVAKGLEFRYVFVTGLNANVFPNRHADTETKMEEERRLLFVCITRAKKELWLSSFGGTDFRGNEQVESNFLKELGFQKKSHEEKRGLEPSNYDHGRTEKRYAPSNNGSTKPSNRNVDLSNLKSVSGRAIDLTSKSSASAFKPGDKVVHTTFGVGYVQEVDAKGRLIIKFSDEIGTKTLIANERFIRLVRE